MSITVTNHGTTNGPLSLDIAGPITGPTLTQVAPSGTRVIALPDLTLAEGDHLVIGSREQQWAILNGTTRVDSYLTSRQWFVLEPGENVITLTDTSETDLSGQLTITAYSAW